MLEVIRAGIADKAIIANLMELYVYDLSRVVPEHNLFSLNQQGRFGYPRFDSFWQDSDRRAYLFKWDGQLAGFSLIHGSSFYHKQEAAKVIGEFCVLNMYCNHGLGTAAAEKIMRLQPGYWEMRVIDPNKRAVKFWHKVVKHVANDYVIHEKNDHEWLGKVFVANIG